MMTYLSQAESQALTGILVVNNHRRMVSLNRRFIEMWSFPKHLIVSRDEKLTLEFASLQLKNPESFLKGVQEIYTDMELEIHDTIKLKEGLIFERQSMPQYLEDKCVGRIWKFREMTECISSKKYYLLERGTNHLNIRRYYIRNDFYLPIW